MRLQGKNAIVTGSNRGIGLATVKRFAQEGCNVWACARIQNDEFEKNISAISEQYGVWIKPVYFELSDESQIKEAVKSIIAEKLPIDILVNNAGIPFGGLMMMTPVSKLKEVFEINYFAQIQITQLVVRIMMRQKSGSIINMASVGGIETEPGYLAYGSSKAALIWATRCMAKELGPHGIRINAVAPGLTQTTMGNYKNEEELNKVINRTSLHRMAEPDEICQAITYLASDEASFVTGHVLVVDGGRSI